jgi:hypothetical protein
MKRTLLVVALLFAVIGLASAQVRIATAYQSPLLPGTSQDSIMNGLKSARGAYAHPNPEGDGKAEIAVTSYSGGGRVVVFQVVGNDSIQLVWTSPKLSSTIGSTPRWVMWGDLDSDGKNEIIFQYYAGGIYVFEHDGVPGSHNYGTTPSQVITTPTLPNVTGHLEYMDIANVDADPAPELLVPMNASTNATDVFAVISATPGSDWSTNDPGFSSFQTEFIVSRTGASPKYNLATGSPYSMHGVNFDGIGPKEIILQDWNYKTVTPVVSTAADTYVMADTTNNKAYVALGGPLDDVALFGGLTYDIDKDGREELYLPTYWATNAHAGWVHMISYAPGDNLREIDSVKNVTLLNTSSASGTTDHFGFGYGDIDGNGKPNLYFGGGYKANVISLEFQGGDKKNPANWVSSIVYPGDSTILTAVTYRDSLGRLDTLKSIDGSFVSKMYAAGSDLDKDGKEDMVLPYQAMTDTVVVRRLTWNATNVKWDTVRTVIPNPKFWGLRILEKGGPTGIEAKDLTIITPEDFRLEQNYPNPFNPSTTISFTLPVSSRISLRVFDALGREVRTLVANEERERGIGSVVWDGRDNAGRTVASGTYFYTLRFGNFEKTNKMMLLK